MVSYEIDVNLGLRIGQAVALPESATQVNSTPTMQNALTRASMVLCLLTFSTCEKTNKDLNQWDYYFDLSAVFQSLDRGANMQTILFIGDTTVRYHQTTLAAPVLEIEATRLPPGFGGARGGLIGIRIDSLSAFVTYAARVTYHHPDWRLESSTYYSKFEDSFDIYDLWGMYTDKPPDYRPGIFVPLVKDKLDTIAGAHEGAFTFNCRINKHLIQQLD